MPSSFSPTTSIIGWPKPVDILQSRADGDSGAPVVPGACNRSKHGGRLPRLENIEKRARQPVLWVPPTARESAIERIRSGAEQRARTTAVAIVAAAQNGTYVFARGPQAPSASGSTRHAANRQRGLNRALI